MNMENKEARKCEKKERKAQLKDLKKEIKQRRKGFWADFKKFITKGNVVDLAVAVVLGAAFNAIVNGLVKLVINPLIAVFTGGVSLDGVKTVIHPEVLDEAGEVVTEEIAILWGQWIQTILDFFIIAMTIFLIARYARRAINLAKRRELEAQKEAEAKKKAEEAEKAAAAAALQAEEKAKLEQMYANIARQTELLEKLVNKQ